MIKIRLYFLLFFSFCMAMEDNQEFNISQLNNNEEFVEVDLSADKNVKNDTTENGDSKSDSEIQPETSETSPDPQATFRRRRSTSESTANFLDRATDNKATTACIFCSMVSCLICTFPCVYCVYCLCKTQNSEN